MEPNPVVSYQPLGRQAVQMQEPVPQARALVGPSKYSCGARTLGILQIILAGLSTVAGVVNFIYNSWLCVIASPIWGGLLFYLPAGILGIVSMCVSPTSRRCVAIGWMVMAILAACIAGGNIAYAGISINDDKYGEHSDVTVAMDSIVAFVSLTELVIAIVSAAYCCLIMGELTRQTNAVTQYLTVQARACPTAMVPGPPAYGATHNANVVLVPGGGGATGGAPTGYYFTQNAPGVDTVAKSEVVTIAE